MYQSLRCVPAGQEPPPAAITQRAWLLVTAGRQTEPVAQPPPRAVVAQKRVVTAHVGAPAVAVPVAVQPGYIGVSALTPTPKTKPLAIVACQFGV